MITSEVINITVPTGFSLSSSEFRMIVEDARKEGALEQYAGMKMTKPRELVWVIQWPEGIDPQKNSDSGDTEDFRVKLKHLDVGQNPASLYFPFKSSDAPRPALVAPVTQFAIIALNSFTDPKKPEIAKPLDKTFTDCYYAKGFTGGAWAQEKMNERLCYYYLGWENIGLHDEYARTELFDEEINKLLPYFAEGSGAFYAEMKKL